MSGHSLTPRYSWRKGSQNSKQDAEAIGQKIEDMAEAKDGLTAHDVVAEAEPEDSVLHPCFEWDDSKAAKRHRLWQARTLMREIVIEVPPEAPGSEPEPVSFSIMTSVVPDEQAPDGRRRYVATGQALADPDTRGLILRQALTRLERVKAQYGHLKDLSSIWDAIDAQTDNR